MMRILSEHRQSIEDPALPERISPLYFPHLQNAPKQNTLSLLFVIYTKGNIVGSEIVNENTQFNSFAHRIPLQNATRSIIILIGAAR